ncbi:DNA primase [Companilactobacillus sp. RD055328]|uniref:DNA primase n=1 Tax=Companilactobacillus sp. RD055328 TaxID=2916634 RepID=UPI001FC7C482|nr:DNA primase [Companilactobacillus sp. RD055328]GKQ42664.1 DNA primase [Companilactobacillus sp. RD055328]
MAGRIPEDFIEQVRSKTDIVDVVSNYVQLKKSGKNLFGHCPFHDERTGSFSVAEDKQIFHCFSCGRGGNVFSFIMEIEKMNFPESVIKVAEMTGISVPENLDTNSNNDNPQNVKFNELQKLYSEAQVLYQHILKRTTTGEEALEYLKNRELTEETIETYGIGFAPDKKDFLYTFFIEKDISKELLRESGLFSENEEGEMFDRFRGRVMFPIKDQNGKIIAFSGRILHKQDNVAKYLNSPETLLFNKSKVLFNYDLAKKNVRDSGQVVLFEGFMDVISAYQAGVMTGVASMGTSLTDQQIHSLSRLSDKLIVCYDGDQAGQNATHRSVSLLRNQNIDIGIVILPESMDPDEFIKNKGKEAFQKVIKSGTQTIISFELNRMSQNYNFNNDRDKLEFLDAAMRELAKVNSAVEIELYLQKLADTLDIAFETLQKQFTSIQREELIKRPPADFGTTHAEKNFAEVAVKPEKINTKLDIAQQNLLYLTLRFKDVFNKLVSMPNFAFIDDKYNKIFGSWAEIANDSMGISEFMDHLSNELKPVVAQLELKDFPEEYTDEEVNDYISVIMNNSLVEDYDNIKKLLSQAAANNDDEQVLELTSQLILLKNKILNLNNTN